LEHGFLAQNGWDVLNWSGVADQWLKALAIGKTEVGGGLIYRCIKPLEAGLEVKNVGSVRSGSLRLVGVKLACVLAQR